MCLDVNKIKKKEKPKQNCRKNHFMIKHKSYNAESRSDREDFPHQKIIEVNFFFLFCSF